MSIQGREIPEEVAARTDSQNEFPAEMWKKLGDAGLVLLVIFAPYSS
jgi:alkylation response protein AidB-like acyl-CoA dehydrogenase